MRPDGADSNWPLRLSFPVFVRNCVLASLEDEGLGPRKTLSAGETVSLRAPRGATRVSVTPPRGPGIEIPVEEERALFADTENYHHAHEYVNAWMGTRAAEWLINNYAYGHANTKVDLTQVDPNLVTAFGLKDPATIAEPKTHVLRSSPQRIPMAKAWEEIKAA